MITTQSATEPPQAQRNYFALRLTGDPGNIRLPRPGGQTCPRSMPKCHKLR
jgi:hypothetical protein